jgi:hypothetical protein
LHHRADDALRAFVKYQVIGFIEYQNLLMRGNDFLENLQAVIVGEKCVTGGGDDYHRALDAAV